MKLHIYAHTQKMLRGKLAYFDSRIDMDGYIYLTSVEIDASEVPSAEDIQALLESHDAEQKKIRIAEMKRMIEELES